MSSNTGSPAHTESGCPSNTSTLAGAPDHPGQDVISTVLGVALLKLAQCLTPTDEDWAVRQAFVADHVRRLQESWGNRNAVRILPFGSSLSGLCLADSDIDLGLFRSATGTDLQALPPQQAKKLLYSVASAIQSRRMCEGKVQTVMGARVPVLKYKCALSGLDCDISIQDTGALVKANFIQIMHTHCPALSPLYRLVKCWAAAHDLNDASRSTFNSTSLLYLAVFYLQLQGLLPPLRDLVEPGHLVDPAYHLLHPANRHLWNHQMHLYGLLASARRRTADWVQSRRAHSSSSSSSGSFDQPDLASLLEGFFTFYSDLMTDWVLGRRREAYADLWAGQLTSQRPAHEVLGKDYLFLIQDPFDPVDCPARAIGTLQKSNNGVGTLIAYLLTCSNRVIKRYHQAAASGSGSGSGTSSGNSLRQGLCQCLAWLFGPQAVLHLGAPVGPTTTFPDPFDSHTDATDAAGSVGHEGALFSAAHWQDWAACPFEAQLCNQLCSQQAKMQAAALQHQRGTRVKSHASPAVAGRLFRYLVHAVGAALEPERGPCVLCLDHLQLLNDRIADGLLQGALGAALAAGAAERQLLQQQQRQQLEEERREWQQRRLPGPPLPEADAHVKLIYKKLHALLGQQRWQPWSGGKRRSPESHPKVVKEAVRDAITQVAQRMQDLGGSMSQHAAGQGQGPDQAAAVDDAEGIGGYGLDAVLQQHGFLDLLEQWFFVQDGCIWGKLLPFPEHLHQRQANAHSAAAPPPAAHHAPKHKHAAKATAAAAAAGASSSSSSSKRRARARDRSQPAHSVWQQKEGLEVEVELQGGFGHHHGAVSSITVAALEHGMQQLSVEVELARTAGAGSSHDLARGRRQQQEQQHLQGWAQQQHRQQEQHGVHWHSQQHYNHHGEQLGSQQHRHPYFHQEGHYDSVHPASPDSGRVQVVPRPNHVTAEPGLAVAPFECHSVQAFATHGDGLAESYCRQLQEKLSPSPPAPKVVVTMQQQRLHQTQGQQQSSVGQQAHHHSSSGVQVQQPHEPRHPAADLLAHHMAAGPAEAGVAYSPLGGNGTAFDATAGGSSTAAGKARLRLQKAKYKVAQLQDQEARAANKIPDKEQELQYNEAIVEQVLTSAGPEGEWGLSHPDRQRLLEAKQVVYGTQQSLKMLRSNLNAARAKLPAALGDLAAADAAWADAEAAGAAAGAM